ncbi:uncharacterized protein LOC117468618 [Trematomus bernacchii]|uniref:uncharacterized protein LOC117468618 n=1 Tax=Trematomus bernacchii TaxID=40690 RepID=UPI00146A406E|nr:uncharacterized protein LOC117468618 [Trematomus bernacchii]
MNLVKNKTMHPHMLDDEALVVENAIRLAVDSIINVLYGVNSARSREYQRTVADRDKQIEQLQGRLTEVEQELQGLQTPGCTCGGFGKGHSLLGSQTSGEPQSCSHPQRRAEQPECDILGLFARPPSHVSSQSHESALPSSPSRVGLDQSCTSHSSETSGVFDEARNLPTSPSSLVIKEEPCDIDTVLINWEISDERFEEHQESTGSQCHDNESPNEKDTMENTERRTFGERPHEDPGGHYNPHEEDLRNRNQGVPTSEREEEAQRLKRAAWRAASKRYYARKVARQQANPSRSGPFPPRSNFLPSRSAPFPQRSGPFVHITDNRFSQPISFVEEGRRSQTEESQSLQREAWSASSRRYYARKNADHQTEPTQYPHLQNMEPSRETLGASSGGSHSNSGGIMCS